MISIKSAEDMYQEMVKNADQADIIIMAAAVADYTPVTTAENKIKKTEGDFSIPLKRTKDILLSIGQQKKDGQFICGFSMETENMLENSRKKLIKKNADMICANNLRQAGAGYQVDTNILTLIQNDFEKELPLLSKDEAANEILTVIKNSLKK